MIIYCHLPKDKLYSGTLKNWKDNLYIEYKERIKNSIKKIGLMNPLSCGNDLQKLHKSKIKKISREEPSWFGVYPIDEWTCNNNLKS